MNSRAPRDIFHRRQAKKGALDLRASSAGPSAAHNGSSPKTAGLLSSSSTFLPPWVLSGITRITGRECGYSNINTSMQCLNALHCMLSKYVQGIKRESMAHVSRTLFCPCLACKGVIKVHASNGTFVAVAEDGNVLYARCSDRTCRCEKEELENGLMDIVEGSDNRPWIKLTAEKLQKLEDTASAAAVQHSRKKHKGPDSQ